MLICMNFSMVFFMWTYLDKKCACTSNTPDQSSATRLPGKHERSDQERKSSTVTPLDNIYDLPNTLITLVLRDFETFEHDVVETVRSFHMVFPHMPIVLFADKIPYPPIHFPTDEFGTNITVVSLSKELNDSSNRTRLERYLKTDYVLFTPDSVRFTQPAVITEMVKHIFKHTRDIVAVRIAGEKTRCLDVEVDLKEWTLIYKEKGSGVEWCDALLGNHLLFVRTRLVLDLSDAVARPFPQAFFIQTSLRDMQVHLLQEHFVKAGRTLFTTDHSRQKRREFEEARSVDLYNRFGIKKVHQAGGEIRWYGCDRDTSRCFGTVVDDTPEYLYRGRWTPPCCLENLRKTARYVFRILDLCHVRYWLEGGSLLGAVRNHDIIPWDYDVDIGIYQDDIEKCEWLKNSRKQSVIDSDGFVWEKATEGDFFRVHYSPTNHMHVDIFPFYVRDGGVMTKNTWFTMHKQDCEFPETYLKPLTKILFAGVYAAAPNNATKFLELKFGKGVVEKPEYPNPKVLRLKES